MPLNKREVLETLSVGHRIAEEEIEHLSAYFVETDQWRRIFAGEVDVVYGPKGSGKSAIYSTLLDREDELFDRGIIAVSAENPQGATAFQGLVADPPTSEREFVGLWKIYFASLSLKIFKTYGIDNEFSREVERRLNEAGLVPAEGTGLRSIVRDVLHYVRRVGRIESVEGGVKLDPHSGLPSGITGKISLAEPSAEDRAAGTVSADRLLELVDDAFAEADYELWVLLDRLDVAFAESPDLEKNALRALFKVYLDMLGLEHVRPKIFLRNDIWKAITEEGFREASHITRTVTISWTQDALLNLVIRRFLQNQSLREFYGVEEAAVLGDASMQNDLFYRMFPEQVDTGRNPQTFGWMLLRTRDGSGLNAPRELIHLLAAARDQQLRELELGAEEPGDENIFTRAALRAALPQVSKARLEMTLYAENPDLKPYLQALEGERTDQSIESLVAIWKVESADARQIADRLADVGFFETYGTRDEPRYKVPFLYRAALAMVQGSAN